MAEIKNNKGEIYYQSKGIVKSFNAQSGYGFISTIDEIESDIYVHYSNIIMDGKRELYVGDNVEFLYKKHDKGLRAYQVKLIK